MSKKIFHTHRATVNSPQNADVGNVISPFSCITDQPKIYFPPLLICRISIILQLFFSETDDQSALISFFIDNISFAVFYDDRLRIIYGA